MAMTKTILFVFCLCAVTSALAQNSPASSDPLPSGGHEQRAIVGGRALQPRPAPGESAQSPETQLKLLQKGAKEPSANEPIVVPRDLYGNPLGGNPGMNPPPPDAPPSRSPKP
jgi:hypothetical protein